MESIPIVIAALYGLGGLVCLVLIIYLIFRRLRIKKEERFEDRSN